MSTLKRRLLWLGVFAALILLGATAWGLRDPWLSDLTQRFTPSATTVSASEEKLADPVEEPKILELSSQARKNMELVSKPARLQSYWRKVLIPGEVTDRPGLSDRGVTSPVVGVVARVHAYPGDTVRPGETLFTLRLVSEYLQNSQTELFEASQEVELVREKMARLEDVARSGALAQAKIIELENELRRQNARIEARRQDLLTRGLTPNQVAEVSRGEFVSTIDVAAPPPHADTGWGEMIGSGGEKALVSRTGSAAYEVQELAAELGQQVQAGQLLAHLANHQVLYVVGHAFKREAPFLEQAAEGGRPITITFAEDAAEHWPDIEQRFEIRHLANAIDPRSRTFEFFVPLRNQSRTYEKDGETFFVWRFRPGQRARLQVPVEKYEDVFVVPAGAVVREGPEAYVFRQNGDLFKRLPVHVLHEDRDSIVIADDGSVTPGTFLAQGSAASLNRVLKAQAASGEQPGLHVHADGTVHAD